MTNRDAIRRNLERISKALEAIEFQCTTEIVADDTRRLVSDINGAMRQHLRTPVENIEESADVKPLYDRVKSIQVSLRVLRNTLDLCDAAVDDALQACQQIANAVEEIEDNDL
jgi:hypothetical protein